MSYAQITGLPQTLENLGKCPLFKKVSENLEKPRENVGKAYKSGNSQGIIFGLEFVVITLLLCLLLLAIALKLYDSQRPCSKMGVATEVMDLKACTPLKSSHSVVADMSLLVMEKSGKNQGILLLIFCGNYELCHSFINARLTVPNSL